MKSPLHGNEMAAEIVLRLALALCCSHAAAAAADAARACRSQCTGVLQPRLREETLRQPCPRGRAQRHIRAYASFVTFMN